MNWNQKKCPSCLGTGRHTVNGDRATYTVPCAGCDGTGEVSRNACHSVCEKCDGVGSYIKWYECADCAYRKISQWSVCARCDSKRSVAMTVICHVCNGTGCQWNK